MEKSTITLNRLRSRDFAGVKSLAKSVVVCTWLMFEPVSNLFGTEPFEETSGGNTIQQVAPYSIPAVEDPTPVAAPKTMDANEIAQVAARMCGPANLVVKDLDARKSRVDACSRDEYMESMLREVRLASATRFRENASGQAMKLHYGIAACNMADDLFVRIQQELNRQRSIQTKLVQDGIPIPDPLLLDRLQNKLDDEILENDSKRKTFRIQLSNLVGSAIACHYQPACNEVVTPSDCDLCDYVQIAAVCRQEIKLLYRLRDTIDAGHLDVWEDFADVLTNTAAVATGKWTYPLYSKVKRTLIQSGVEASVRKRKLWLDTLILERKNHIQIDLEVAYEQKKNAALRWTNARSQLANWDTRLLQLEKIGEEVQGNLSQQSEARLERLQAESNVLLRWLDWQLARVELQLAIGRVGE